MCDHLVERDFSVEPAERECESRACRRERLEAELREDARRARVPRVRNDERLAFVEGSESLRFLPL
jgi:hypothetical protein